MNWLPLALGAIVLAVILYLVFRPRQPRAAGGGNKGTGGGNGINPISVGAAGEKSFSNP